ncbi:MAG: response regulator transcription factor [Pseudomonadota bacterium]
MVAVGNHKSVLLVEDNQDLAATVGEYLEAGGYILDYAADGLTAMHLAVTENYDAIVLDLNIPGIDGIEVCRRLRNDADLDTPVVMLTARDQLQDKITGFDVGADDYLVKPFDLAELEARIEANIRRAKGHVSRLEVADLSLDLQTMEVSRAGQSIHLSKTLFEILKILMRESPKVVSRESLEKELWGDDFPESDPLRSHLYVLRKLIDKPFDTALLETSAGHGYRICDPKA